MKFRRYYLHVDAHGEHRFDRAPETFPYLTVEVLESDGEFVTERTWTKIVEIPGHSFSAQPRGDSWVWEGKTTTEEHGRSESWIRKRALR